MLIKEVNRCRSNFVVDFSAVDGGSIECDAFVEEHFASLGHFVQENIVAGMAGNKGHGRFFNFGSEDFSAGF